MDREQLAARLDAGWSLERIAQEVDRHPSTVGYWLAKYDLSAVNRERHAARGAIEYNVLAALVEQGQSITEIAAAVGRSKTTVRHWLDKHGLQTLQTVRRVRGGRQMRRVRV